MKIIILILLTANAVVHSFVSNAGTDDWEEFKVMYEKKYENETEEIFRKAIFQDRKFKIEEHNKRFENDEVSFTVKINRFSDLLHHEAFKMLNIMEDDNFRNTDCGLSFNSPANITIPNTVDWREKGAVTSVKNQGHRCGSCWAFSATGALEGQHFIKTGELVPLSVQNLIDCAKIYGNDGCHGGFPQKAFRYIQSNGGIDTEKSYPYEEKDGECRYKPSDSGATDEGCVYLPNGDEGKLKVAVATIGPISVALDSSDWSFLSYQSGIYNSRYCDNKKLNHAVLLVGYGTESGIDYWLIKNSWGTDFGDNGYIKLARNKNNLCGIATMATYPIV